MKTPSFWRFINFLKENEKGLYLQSFRKEGGVAEWSMAAVLKTVVRRRTGGSNPSASAICLTAICGAFFVKITPKIGVESKLNSI